MRVVIDLPDSTTPRTHIAARVATEYVAFELSKLPSEAWPELVKAGMLEGRVKVEYIGLVKWTIFAD